ncbi:hypothetical protein COBT_002344, partial [Conglomerata obtusa]
MLQLLVLFSLILAYDPLFSASAALKDPIGKKEQDAALAAEDASMKKHQAASGSHYNDKRTLSIVSSNFVADMNTPIIPTEEERLVMKNNVAVVMPYL